MVRRGVMFGDSHFLLGKGERREGQGDLIQRLAKRIVDLRLSAPAIFFLESMKPLSFLGSQALVFLQPIVQSFFNFKEYDEITRMLEDRDNVEKLILEIERMESEEKKTKRPNPPPPPLQGGN